jgi:hypothetical protein
MAKPFDFEANHIELCAPDDLEFENEYFARIYSALYELVEAGNLAPQINCDEIHAGLLGFSVVELAREHGVAVERVTAITTNPERASSAKALVPFLTKFPIFFGFIQNLNVPALLVIGHAECLLGAPCSANNFIQLKKIIDDWNRKRWIRDKDLSERQSGVSMLGNISETLLDNAMSEYVDGTNFFKVTISDVQSYGDFVLMCLPNNLWLSVKSNFARERLLASGFTTDILGVGFFTDSTEFTSGAKIRNFQKVGFLAMYVPDIPVTEDQVASGVSTYHQICEFYHQLGNGQPPLNINGKPFIRKLSDLHGDMGQLLQETDISRRVTIGF